MRYVYQIVPGTSGPFVLVGIVGAVLLGVLVVITLAAWGSRRATFEVSPEGLAIRGDLYGRRISRWAIDVAGVRAADLRRDEEFVPTRRTNGTGMPGYAAGWFRLRNGAKALLFVTDRTRVAWVPTQDGYGVLMSVADPAAFVRRAREVWGGP